MHRLSLKVGFAETVPDNSGWVMIADNAVLREVASLRACRKARRRAFRRNGRFRVRKMVARFIGKAAENVGS